MLRFLGLSARLSRLLHSWLTLRASRRTTITKRLCDRYGACVLSCCTARNICNTDWLCCLIASRRTTPKLFGGCRWDPAIAARLRAEQASSTVATVVCIGSTQARLPGQWSSARACAPLLIIRKLSSPTLHPEFPRTTGGTDQFVIQDNKHIKGRHGERDAVLLLGVPVCSWTRRTAAAVAPCTPPPSTTDVSWDSCVEFLCRPIPQHGPSHDRSAGPAPQAEGILTDGS